MILDPYRGAAAEGIDFANVKLLLHFDGAEGATAAVDSSSNPKIIGFADGAILTTVVFKFGAASLDVVENNKNYVSAASSSDYNVGSQDFSFEMFVRVQTTSVAVDRVIACRDQIGGTRGWLIYTEATTGKLGFACWHSSGGTFSLVQTAYDFRAFAIGNWVHVAAVRYGNKIYLYVDGVLVGSADITGKSVGDPNEPVIFGLGWGIGAPITTTTGYCYIDEVRFVVGECAYPGGASFTPPTVAFPDS